MIFWIPVLVSLALLSFGLKSTLKLDHIEENKCNMSYMYHPEYVRIPTASNITNYNLYFYKNPGQQYDLSRKLNEGIPVLFIPGNAGGKYQIRSFASFCFMSNPNDLIDPSVKGIAPQKHRFHYYTIDFNSEFSVFDGRILSRQSIFVQDTLTAILKLYSRTKMSKSPKKVIVVGHSMGGVVATGIFMNQSNVKYVDFMYTINTPHRPILLSHPSLVEYYDQIDSIMKSDAIKNVTIVSIHAGIR